MYINIQTIFHCNECGSSDNELVTRKNETYRRCRQCKHEKLISTITHTGSTPITYQMEKFPNKETF